ncbi:hypothetical protein HYPGJ_30027 [Hyphomicrobium sp. GJ21]|nr:hypothetical protein HYPGJ_30027 [Hyphomicrobium sp. GJ21]
MSTPRPSSSFAQESGTWLIRKIFNSDIGTSARRTELRTFGELACTLLLREREPDDLR